MTRSHDNDNTISETGKNFKRIRETLGFTQAQVAEYMQVDRTLVAKFEAGERTIGMTAMERACRLFGCSLGQMTGSAAYEPIAIAYRAKELSEQDMDAIAKVQKLVLNMRQIKKWEGSMQK